MPLTWVAHVPSCSRSINPGERGGRLGEGGGGGSKGGGGGRLPVDATSVRPPVTKATPVTRNRILEVPNTANGTRTS